MYKKKHQFLVLLSSLFVVSNLVLLAIIFHGPVSESPVVDTDTTGMSSARVSSDSQGISISVEFYDSIKIGQPFRYTIRVVYDPELVKPDFRKFLRDVRFVPFEQLHLSRPTISEAPLSDGRQEYLLSYPVLGINVIPHTSYNLDPVELHYLDLSADKSRTIRVQPQAIHISGYHSLDYFGIPFQPVKQTIEDYHDEKKLAIGINAALLLILGCLLIYNSVKRHNIQVLSRADRIRERFEAVEHSQENVRKGIFSYERLYLALISDYRDHSAQDFWLSRLKDKDVRWEENLGGMKQDFNSAYSNTEPENSIISSIKQRFENVFKYIEPDSIKDKTNEIEKMQGTLRQRIRNYKSSFIGGLACIIASLMFVYFLAKPAVWMNMDVIYFNEWINNLPEKYLDENRTGELESVDIELLSHITEQQQTLDNLKGEYFKSAFLYNYGTIMSNAIVAIMVSSNEAETEEIEEDEVVEPPSFEFPVQLLANSVRFYPSDVDARKNLELAIMYWINEKKDESGEVQGEVGPPLPGFSRDMNEIQY